MALECKHCAHRWPDTSVVEAMLLHFQVEHDTDKVVVDLVAVCDCGATMTFTHTERESSTRDRDHFRCSACGRRGAIRRRL
jgi:hypothetical protein